MIHNYDPLNDPFGYMPEIPGWDKMTDEERKAYVDRHYKATMKGCLFSFIGLVICLLLTLLFGSCTTTRYVPVIEHKTDTLIQTQVRHDSIYFSDSICISDFVRDDTVWRTEYKWRTRYIERVSHDTTYISRRDTIPQPYEVVREVPRKRSKAEWVLLIIGLAALLGVFLYAVKKVKPFLPGL